MEWNDLFRHSPFFVPAFSQDSYISEQTDLENWGPSGHYQYFTDRSSQTDQNWISNKVIFLACAGAKAKDKNMSQEIIPSQLWFSFLQLQGTLHKGPSKNNVGPFFQFSWPPSLPWGNVVYGWPLTWKSHSVHKHIFHAIFDKLYR